MKIGLQVPSFTWPGGSSQLAPLLARIGQTADQAGFASLWVMDHFFQIAMLGKADEPMLEGYSTLSFLAAVTKRVRLVLRGDATLEFERGDFVRMKEGDYVTIPRHVKHRVHQAGPETIWLAVHIR
jgi:mannose-6-phosphate isomerase-like protein (cupin superfamily)